MKDKLSRRKFFKWGSVAASAVASTAVAGEICTQGETGAQGLGPFFPNKGTPKKVIRENPDPSVPIYASNDNDLTQIQGQNIEADGQKVIVEGVVQDANCNPIKGASVVIWQASSTGKYNHNRDEDNKEFRHPKTGQVITRDLDDGFQFWGRAETDANGRYQFKTIVPGFYPADLANGWYRPPHIHFLVSATGFEQLVTQMYFKGEHLEHGKFVEELNGKDYLLQSTNLTPKQRENLVVEFKPSVASGILKGQFDITMK